MACVIFCQSDQLCVPWTDSLTIPTLHVVTLTSEIADTERGCGTDPGESGTKVRPGEVISTATSQAADTQPFSEPGPLLHNLWYSMAHSQRSRKPS